MDRAPSGQTEAPDTTARSALISQRGFVGFNVNYRLSPGATFPDHLVDIKRAIAWVRQHAAEFHVDPSFHEPEKFVDASPIAHVRPDAPPFFVIHGDRDTMAPLADARDFVAELRKVSHQPVLFAEIGGGQHAFDVFVSPRSLPVIQGVGPISRAPLRAAPPCPRCAGGCAIAASRGERGCRRCAAGLSGVLPD